MAGNAAADTVADVGFVKDVAAGAGAGDVGAHVVAAGTEDTDDHAAEALRRW